MIVYIVLIYSCWACGKMSICAVFCFANIQFIKTIRFIYYILKNFQNIKPRHITASKRIVNIYHYAYTATFTNVFIHSKGITNEIIHIWNCSETGFRMGFEFLVSDFRCGAVYYFHIVLLVFCIFLAFLWIENRSMFELHTSIHLLRCTLLMWSQFLLVSLIWVYFHFMCKQVSNTSCSQVIYIYILKANDT